MKAVLLYIVNYFKFRYSLGLIVALLFFTLTTYATSLFNSFSMYLDPSKAYILVGLLCVVGVMAIYGSVYVEHALRVCFSKMLVNHMRNEGLSIQELQALDSVHMTGLIEKLVWSLTDFSKFMLSVLFALCVVSLASILHFLLVVVCITFTWIVLYYTNSYVFTIRKKLAQASRVLVKMLHKTKTKDNSLRKEKVIALFEATQNAMLIWRSWVNCITALIGIVLVISGLLLIREGKQEIGLLIVFTNTAVVVKMRQWVDAYVVLQGESIHFSYIRRVLAI